MDKEIKIGVVGLGWWGQIQMQNFREVPNVKVTALSDIRKELPAEILKGSNYYPDMKEMFEKEKMDGVVIVTPPSHHLKPALLAAERGIHIFCEKPMAASLKDCNEMIEVCKKIKSNLWLPSNTGLQKPFLILKIMRKNWAVLYGQCMHILCGK